jgi:hypothetical protein
VPSRRLRVVKVATMAQNSLDLVPGDDVHGLDVVLEASDHLLNVITGDLVVLDDDELLELLDTVRDGDKLVVTPDQTVLLDGMQLRGELLQVGGVIPRLDVNQDGGLGNDDLLLLLLLGIGLLLGLEGSLVLLSLLTEQIDVIVVDGGSGLRRRSGGLGSGGSSGGQNLVTLGLEVRSHAGSPLDDIDVGTEHLSERLGVLLADSEATEEGLADEAAVELLEGHFF